MAAKDANLIKQPSRRAIVAGASLLPASLAGAPPDGPTIGVIGVGRRGSYLAKMVAEQTPARLAAVADLDEERLAAAARLAPSVTTFRDYQALLKSDVAAVIIATPVFLHAEHLEAAVQAGKHIYIEKPAAPGVADCKRMLRVVDSAPRRINITFGFQRRYGQVYQKAKQALDAGSIGAIRWGQVEFIKSVPELKRDARADRSRNWDQWRDLSGDLIVENNVHLIDVMNWFMGARPSKAHGAGGRTRTGYGDLRDHGQVTYSYPGNVSGVLVGTTLASPGYRRVVEQFHGTDGAIEVSESHWKLIRGREEVAGEKAPRDIGVDSVAAFVRRVAENKPENVGARGIESTLTAILGRMAMDRGREVTWDEMMASA